MKRAILILAVLLPTFKAFTQSQLENQYFAAWEDIESPNAPPGKYQEPVGNTWATSNEAAMPLMGEPLVIKTSDSYIGEYAALIKTSLILGRIASGTLFTGKFKLDYDNFLNSPKFGVPFSDRPYYLKGFYKYIPVNDDSCRIASWLTKWNNSTHRRDTIAFATISYEQSKKTISTYTEFDIIYNYRSAASPDSITVIFASSADGANFHGGIGSALYIDEISLEYFPLSVVQKVKEEKDFIVSPNPVSEYLIVKSKYPPKDVKINIYTSNGSFIKTKKIENSFDKISITELPVGLYMYEITKPDGMIETGKFIKK
jgi:hypothetical protein